MRWSMIFNSSIPFDQRLYREDIEGSMAHASMLGEQGVLFPVLTRRISARGCAASSPTWRRGTIEFSADTRTST